MNILALKWVKLDADLQDEVQHEISALFLLTELRCENEKLRGQGSKHGLYWNIQVHDWFHRIIHTINHNIRNNE